MAGKTQEGALRTRYLLGGESEAECERLEAEYFADDDAFQEMLTAEDDLIDAYARGELSTGEGRQFEQRFLTSAEGRERVQFARAFADATTPQPLVTAPPIVTATSSPGFFASIFGSTAGMRVAFATLTIAVVVGFPWLLIERSRMNTELNELRVERVRLNQKADELQRTADAERLKTADTLAQLKDLQDRTGNENPNQGTTPPIEQAPNKRTGTIDPGGTFANDRRNETPSVESNAFFDLNPGATRGGAGNTLTISRNVRSITLRLGLENESSAEDYRALIETANGRAVKTVSFKGASVPHDRVQAPQLSTTELVPGDYVIFLLAKQSDNSFGRIASYSFRVVKN